MDRIALTGSMYAGKTSLARSLESNGYLFISFTDLLKKYAVESLTACGLNVTLGDVLRDKGVYRAYLQELGVVLGFNNDPRYVYEALRPWFEAGKPDRVVFDNARTPEQWEVLKSLGFTLVEVRLDQHVQRVRAANLGVTGAALEKAVNHPIEGALCGWGSIIVDGSVDPQVNVRLILREEE